MALWAGGLAFASETLSGRWSVGSSERVLAAPVFTSHTQSTVKDAFLINFPVSAVGLTLALASETLS